MKDVYIIDAKRTPQVKAGLDFRDTVAPFLGTSLIRNMMDQAGLPDNSIDEVIVGNIGTPAKYPNIGRVIALDAGLDKTTSAYTVNRNCASGMEAMAQAFLKIGNGRENLMFAGGVESMSQMPLMFGKKMTNLFINMMKAKSLPERIKAIAAFRPYYLAPIIAIEQGLTDPFCELNMGQTAELLARELNITRLQQDEFSNNSHLKTAKAWEAGKFQDEIVPVFAGKNLDKLISKDIGYRATSTVEGLAKMRPYFDKKSGTVTIGNSCPITDGGSMLLLASEDAVKKYDLKPMARIVDYHFAALEPERMGMGPLVSMNGVLTRTGMNLDQMDLFEINEAFAAQMLSVFKGLTDKKIANKFGVEKVWGEVPEEKFNVNGGGIALGHPVGSTGSRIVVTLAHELKKRNAKYGIASLCIGGGQGGACIIENL